ncbi:DUF600 domain-containing protein [Paenibacillus sp. M-152]|uniref:DUF600 domain-containing protein n=1 Tax=Paenibacillus sp. M-152 TaxID=2487928 RepID=UPI000F6C3821|nr:DUF600 domain-containing protein [Paenibacillus sp. M-152]AZH32047.1 DUF600 domain-containing protein [Paenibacillus sp. M-152]
MVSICLEYVNDRADKIYIYCSYEEGMISSDFFYRINNKVIERHKLNDVLNSAEKDVFVYDVSVKRQRGVIKIINNDIEKSFHLCKRYGREIPTEMKIIYDVKSNKLTANYNYELVHTNHPVKTADDISMEWFEQIQAEKSF